MKRAISYLAAKYISDNLGQKVLRIMFEILYPQDDYQAFCSRYDPSPHPTLVNAGINLGLWKTDQLPLI